MNKTVEFWDKQSDKYNATETRYEQTYSKIVENTRQHLNVSDVVLDYACGTGSIAIEIADRVKQIYAIDISSGMIDVATRKAGERRIENVNFAQSSLFEARYGSESFDVILAFNILHLLEDTAKVMQRINELLKPGGLFISATACLGEKRSFWGTLLPLLSKTGAVPYVKSFKISELEDSIAKGKFQIVDTEVLSHAPPNYFVVARKIQRR